MPTIVEYNKFASDAINDAFQHYFTNLASGQEKIHEAKFVAATIQAIQPWLFFTEEAMENLVDSIYKDQLYLNFVFTMTAIWRQRFPVNSLEYEEFINHLANTFFTHEHREEGMSIMAKEYRDRLISADAAATFLINNRFLVMLLVMVLYLDTNILAAALMGAK